MTDNLGYWVGFSKVPGIGPARLRSLLDYYGDVALAWQADPGELRAIGLDRRSVENLVKVRSELNLEAELEKLNKLNISVFTWDNPDYPKLLRPISDAPLVLYVRGSLLPEDEWAVAVVGTRQATAYGKECTQFLVNGLAKNGITIVSGMAYGIDTQAHQTALAAGGRTIAVLGCGVDIIYPAENKKLGQAIIEHGALVSEYPLGTNPESGNFPRRNRIISGLSLGVLFVEGTTQSGARITTDFALEQGRDVFAVPGSILRQSGSGPNYLIQNGAKLVTQVNDILEELNLTMVAQHVEARAIIPENDLEALLLKQLSTEPVHVDDLGQVAGLSAAEVASALTLMELKGMVRQVGGMNYVVARETGAEYTLE
ncbi:MAG: DNA processing protein DprA [Chloroflexota bacterium]|nr:MAG: DNA processing protein DprA [Chloroflexota bacterium]